MESTTAHKFDSIAIEITTKISQMDDFDDKVKEALAEVQKKQKESESRRLLLKAERDGKNKLEEELLTEKQRADLLSAEAKNQELAYLYSDFYMHIMFLFPLLHVLI